MNFPGIRQNHCLAPYSSYQVGGRADYFYDLVNLENLAKLLNIAKKEGITVQIIGGGTNILFRDEGFRGLIIRILANQIIFSGSTMVAEAGAKISMILLAAKKNGFNNLDPFFGLPGTIGGAVFGNAGASGLEMRDVVEKVELFNLEKGYYFLTNQELEFGYRKSKIKSKKINDPICRIFINLKKISVTARVESLKNRLSQPKGLTCGCWFTNPPDKSAGKIIDDAGLKGFSIGKAIVSEKHANFIINQGGATAKEILAVARHVQSTVKSNFNINLEDEVRVI